MYHCFMTKYSTTLYICTLLPLTFVLYYPLHLYTYPQNIRKYRNISITTRQVPRTLTYVYTNICKTFVIYTQLQVHTILRLWKRTKRQAQKNIHYGRWSGLVSDNDMTEILEPVCVHYSYVFFCLFNWRYTVFTSFSLLPNLYLIQGI